MFRKILLATDGSEYAFHAATTALEIAKLNPKAHIHIVYVIDISNAKSDMLQYWNSNGADEQRMEKIKPIVDLIIAARINYSIHFLRGEPGPMLVKYANEESFDLVVVGSRGKNRFQELLLGSVSHKVAKGANCPVMIVKTKELKHPKNVSTLKEHLKQNQNI
ncbi:nucleotide-binding universal stress UspA family protein [Evansella vedderi]|uniref:Nucleotide-binding universal stress UspA family protein n=1 Tax=Evansella vedderi TaxID=38282 RepID=A0ABU0A4N9_9BACI|nr:universal stress protein [Evansella vedderi]MDQ0258069.1 nucleotide-binding universal stress UspA family protein [Evansella vedderi]